MAIFSYSETLQSSAEDYFEIFSSQKDAELLFSGVTKIEMKSIRERVINLINNYQKYFKPAQKKLYATLGKSPTRIVKNLMDQLQFNDVVTPSGKKLQTDVFKKAIVELLDMKENGSFTQRLQAGTLSAMEEIKETIEEIPTQENLERLKKRLDDFFNASSSEVPKMAGLLLEVLTTQGQILPQERKEIEQMAYLISEEVLGSINQGASDIVQKIKLKGSEGGEFVVPISLKLKTTLTPEKKYNREWSIGNSFSGTSIRNFFTKKNALMNETLIPVDTLEWAAINIPLFPTTGLVAKEIIKELSFLNGLIFILLGNNWKQMMSQALNPPDKMGNDVITSLPPLLIGSYSAMVHISQALSYFKFIVENARYNPIEFNFQEKWAAAQKNYLYSFELNKMSEEAVGILKENSDIRRSVSLAAKFEGKSKGEKGQEFWEHIRALAKTIGTTQDKVLEGLSLALNDEIKRLVPRPKIDDYISVQYSIAINNIMAKRLTGA